MLERRTIIIICFLWFAFSIIVYWIQSSSSSSTRIDSTLISEDTRKVPYTNISKEAVYSQCQSFSQGNRLLGPLKRDIRNGELFFPDENTALQEVYLLLRFAPRKNDEGGLYLQLATSYLLSKNLRQLSMLQRNLTRVDVFLSEGYTDSMYLRLEKWFTSIFTPYTNATRIIRTTTGNQVSWEYMMNYTKYNTEVHLDTILFLLEDDYIYETTMLVDTIEFFASHNPYFVHQTDYPDRYTRNINNDDGHITIVAGKTRLWRSIPSITVTYACRMRTFLAFEDIIMQPRNDWKASHAVRQRAGNAAFFCAIPSHGAHTESLLWPKKNAPPSKVALAALYKDWWLFARRALFEAQKEETFPADKLKEIIEE